MASDIICLDDNQKFNFSKYILDNMVKSLEGGIKFYLFLRFLQVFLDNQVEGMKRHKEMRMIKDIHQDDEIALDADTQGRKNDDEMFVVNDLSGEEVVLDTTTGEHEEQIIQDVSTAKPVNTYGKVVTTVTDKVSAAPTTYVTEDEITMAQALAALKSIKPKVVVQEQEVSTTIPAAATTVTTVVPTPRAKDNVFHEQKQSHIPIVSSSKDEGKAKMIEPELPIKKKDQMRMDEELQARERKELSEVQKARLLVELIEKRKKHFATLRAQEKRNKPPTKAQIRSQMCTYLRNIGGYKHSHLKGWSYDEINKLFDKEMRKINNFIAMDSEAQKSSGKEAQESNTKRTAESLESDISKKQKVYENDELVIDDTEELKKCMEIVLDDEYENYFKIIRADSNSQVYQTFEKMFKNFNREDLEVLWGIVKYRFKKEKLVDDMDNLLFRTLKTMFEHHVKDTIWTYQQGLAKVKN
nr:hypothetical protein [Tanacetum cinerariifolium]